MPSGRPRLVPTLALAALWIALFTLWVAVRPDPATTRRPPSASTTTTTSVLRLPLRP